MYDKMPQTIHTVEGDFFATNTYRGVASVELCSSAIAKFVDRTSVVEATVVIAGSVDSARRQQIRDYFLQHVHLAPFSGQICHQTLQY